jgi:hypothetical protein
MNDVTPYPAINSLLSEWAEGWLEPRSLALLGMTVRQLEIDNCHLFKIGL